MFGLLKSGKLTLRCVSDRSNPLSPLGERHENFQPGFSHEEAQHDGTAQSVVSEVIPRERSGRPDVDQANNTPKTIKKKKEPQKEREDPLLNERGDPLYSEIPEWLQEFREFGG